MKNKKKRSKRKFNFFFYFVCGLLLFAFVISLGSVGPSVNKKPSSSQTESPGNETEPPSTPTYNGVIPKGTYTVDLSRTDLVDLSIDREGVRWVKFEGYETAEEVLDIVAGPLDAGIELWCYEGCGSCYNYGDGETLKIEVVEEIEVTEEEFNAFMYDVGLFDEMSETPDEPETPSIPEYKGYIPAGEYKLTTVVGDELHLTAKDDEDGDPIGWFTHNSSIELHDLVFEGSSVLVQDAILGDYYAYAEVGDTIEVLVDFAVTEEEYNGFWQYFESCDSDIPTYNGVIPLGIYKVVTVEGDGFTIAPEDEEGLPVLWFSRDDSSLLWTIEIYDGEISIADDTGDYGIYLTVGDTFQVKKEIEVTEEKFNAFMHYFTPQ